MARLEATMESPESVVLPWGVHRGQTLGHILEVNPRYLAMLTEMRIRESHIVLAVGEMNRTHADTIDRAVRRAMRRPR
jgi:hypothetical protein